MKKILVIDDEPQILWLVSARLQGDGYAVVTALSGQQGLEKAEWENPDLVLLDRVMADMNGDEVLVRLKKNAITKHIPVVMFTADVKRVEVGEYRSKGAADCLFKPFAPEELLSKIREVLEKKV